MRLGLVIHRYGEGISGGAEVHCRMLAQRLVRLFPSARVEVITTTASDYLTWANDHKQGDAWDGKILVRRFRVARERDLTTFDFVNRLINAFCGHAPRYLERIWLARQGPCSPELLAYLDREAAGYDRLIFYTYLYEPTVLGLPLAARRSGRGPWFIPTAHDEKPLRLKIIRPAFAAAGSLGFLSPAEERLVLERFPVADKPRRIIAAGVEPPKEADPKMFVRKFGLGPYLLYLGRVDVQKGIPELLDYWKWAMDHINFTVGPPTLVLAGESKMGLESRKGVVLTGYLSEEEKWSALSGALGVVAPSPYESLNLTVLEAGAVGRPVLVNSGCQVLADYVRRSGGGLAFHDRRSFGDSLEQMADPRRAGELGQANREHVGEHYSWKAFDRKLVEWLDLNIRTE